MKSLMFGAVLALATAVVASHPGSPAYAQAAPDGAIVFKQRCASCHTVAGKGGKVGPDLTGVAGRKAGSTAYAYSAAMKGSGMIWNAKTLDAYLAAPTKALPGTKMTIALSKPEDRKAVVAFLAQSAK